uniref:Potassium channel domain-containing protein n=1 Tax=Romanomermis culicivorax TaxID=13658 RepID=A0A915KFW2_ROMCU
MLVTEKRWNEEYIVFLIAAHAMIENILKDKFLEAHRLTMIRRLCMGLARDTAFFMGYGQLAPNNSPPTIRPPQFAPGNSTPLQFAPDNSPPTQFAPEQIAPTHNSPPMTFEKKEITKSVAKYLLTNGGLFLLVTVYVVGGAYIFRLIEYDGFQKSLERHSNVSYQLEENRSALARNIWDIRRQANFSDSVRELMMVYHSQVAKAMQDDYYTGRKKNVTDMRNGWTITSAILFTITVVTTIGYGHVCPTTSLGQTVTIFYALAGVPLMLMFLANIGDLMARVFRLAYGRCCCYICWKKRKENYEINRRRITDMRQSRLAQRAWASTPGGLSDVGRDNKAFIPEDADKDSRILSAPLGGRTDDQEPARRRTTNKLYKQWKKLRHTMTDTPDPAQTPAYDIYEVIEDPDDDGVINVPISLTVVVIAAYLFIGAILFSTWNGWSWITGAYFSFVTLATIGFGDLVPGWDDIRQTRGQIKVACSILYIVIGLAVLSMCFNLMMEEMISKFTWLGRRLGIIEDQESTAGGNGSGKKSAGAFTVDDDKLFLVEKRSRQPSPASTIPDAKMIEAAKNSPRQEVLPVGRRRHKVDSDPKHQNFKSFFHVLPPLSRRLIWNVVDGRRRV